MDEARIPRQNGEVPRQEIVQNQTGQDGQGQFKGKHQFQEPKTPLVARVWQSRGQGQKDDALVGNECLKIAQRVSPHVVYILYLPKITIEQRILSLYYSFLQVAIEEIYMLDRGIFLEGLFSAELAQWLHQAVTSHMVKQGRSYSPGLLPRFNHLPRQLLHLLSVYRLVIPTLDVPACQVLQLAACLNQHTPIRNLHLHLLPCTQPNVEPWKFSLSVDSKQGEIVMNTSEWFSLLCSSQIVAHGCQFMQTSLQQLSEGVLGEIKGESQEL